MKQRGVFEKVRGSGVWWVRHVDADGILRREKVGSKSAAIKLYRKRKTDALEGRKLPQNLRKPPIALEEIAKDAPAYSKAHKATYSDDKLRMDRILGWFKGRTAESITPQDIERRFEEGVAEHGWAPSTVNHYPHCVAHIPTCNPRWKTLGQSCTSNEAP